MKAFFFLWVLAIALGIASRSARAGDVDHDDLHVYLLIGQSNMAGRAALDDAKGEPIGDCLLFNGDDEWEPASHPLNRYSTIRKGLGMQKLGLGGAFAEAMLADQTGVTLGLVVNAKGGSSIGEWEKGSRFYREAVRRAKAAARTGKLEGILWHQGESDHKHPEAYADKLAQLVKDLRQDLGDAKLPFVAGQVHDVPAINAEIAKLPELSEHTAFVRSEGLTTKDRWHFDSKGITELGKRYASAMKGLQK